MKKFLTIALAAAIALCCTSAFAGQIWTDGNGDGLPDAGPISVAPNTNVTVGVWIDAQSFTWTNYLAYVEWTPGCLTYLSATYIVTGGSNFPIDDFSHPNGVGFGGQGFSQGGVDLIGNINLRIDTPVSCCVTPIIDVYNPYYVFSQLGAGAAYQLFTTNPGTCYGDPAPATGACCFADGSCAILSASACAAQGGTYAGNDVSCAQANCPPPPPRTGACCFADGSCSVLTSADCTAQGGTYAGDDVSCAAANCIQPPTPQACCFPTGACADLLAADCAAQGGIAQGAGTACAGTVCPPPPPRTGACCFADGSCVVLTAADCAAQGGAYAGDDVSCAAANCPQPPVLGACCLPGGICVDGTTGPQCADSQGTWFPNQLCSEISCTTPVESKSWGEIKGLYR